MNFSARRDDLGVSLHRNLFYIKLHRFYVMDQKINFQIGSYVRRKTGLDPKVGCPSCGKKATSPELLFEKEHLRRIPFSTRHLAILGQRPKGEVLLSGWAGTNQRVITLWVGRHQPASHYSLGGQAPTSESLLPGWAGTNQRIIILSLVDASPPRE